MAEVIIDRFPRVDVQVGDIQNPTEYPDEYFDRILAIHVLEHLPDLPNALKEIYRILKKGGTLSVVIPCEGGLAYLFARQISTARIFKKQFGDRGISYQWLMRKTEHINMPSEILEELRKLFLIKKKRFFPFSVPLVFCNLCIGLHLKKKQEIEKC
jgi:ubiquinone/menaquinone biosynthesis C-methylase UbiE